MSERTENHPSTNDLYVNYLPMPRRHARFLRVALPAALWLLVGAALAWALTQRDPGGAVWDDGRPVQIRGVLSTRPCAVLHTDEGPVLLVEVGKHGPRRLGAFEGAVCAASGWPLRRDGRRMLELEPGDNAVRVEAATPPQPPHGPRVLGPVMLRGEIVDAKCFLGAMKPGDGKTHKECATLCIRGGIPAMLVSHGADGAPVYHILTAMDDGPIDASIHPLIADLVEIRGELIDWNGLLAVRIEPSGVRRAN
ncbi:MAG: hypothetical protein KF869_10405 [Phycisphaeraceae bacterium]|nr:hypothetical protein [Phycisphaeraceae bacterium]